MRQSSAVLKLQPDAGAVAQASEKSRPLETLDDAVRKTDELVERWNHWLARQNLNLIERYLGGDTKLAIRRVDVGPPYYGAILEPWPLSWHAESLLLCRRGDNNAARGEGHSDEPIVFSCHIEAMDSVKQIVSTRVRLQTFDDRPIRRGEPLFAFCHVQRVNEALVRPINRKVMIGSSRYAVATRERCGQQVEAGSDAIDNCSDARVVAGWQASIDFQLKQLLPHLRVRFFDQQVWGVVEPGLESVLEGWEMGSGPVNGPVGVF